MASKKAIVQKETQVTQPQKETVASLSASRASVEMFKNPKVFIPLIVIIVAALLFYFKGLFIAAVVNGTPISRFSVISELEKTYGKQTLSSLIAKTLIFQEAQKRNVTVNQQEVDDAVKKISDSLIAQGQNFDQALAMQGMTKEDFAKQVKIQKLVEKMFGKDIKVADKEVTDYIEKNKDTIPSNLTGENLNKSAKQQLEQQKLSDKFQSWLTNAQKNAKIMYFVNF